MKKYLYPILYVLLHVLTVFVVVYICVIGFKLSYIKDIVKTTSIALILCSLEGIILGFIANKKSKYKAKEIVITSILIAVLLFAINQMYIDLQVLVLKMIHVFSFNGLFMKSLIRDPLFGENGIYVYLLYYTLMFNIGIFAYGIMNKLKSKS